MMLQIKVETPEKFLTSLQIVKQDPEKCNMLSSLHFVTIKYYISTMTAELVLSVEYQSGYRDLVGNHEILFDNITRD